LLGHRLADVHLAEALHVGNALEVEDALDQLVGVLHLADRFLTELVPQPLVAPVLAHPAVDEVLVDRGQLGRENVVQEGDDLLVASHSPPPPRGVEGDARPLWAAPRASSSSASSTGEQPPQSPPAPQMAASRSRVSPPRAIVARIAISPSPRHRHTIIDAYPSWA